MVLEQFPTSLVLERHENLTPTKPYTKGYQSFCSDRPQVEVTVRHLASKNQLSAFKYQKYRVYFRINHTPWSTEAIQSHWQQPQSHSTAYHQMIDRQLSISNPIGLSLVQDMVQVHWNGTSSLPQPSHTPILLLSIPAISYP